MGAWPYTPPCPSILTRFFSTEDFGLTHEVRGSAHRLFPHDAISTRGELLEAFRHSLMFRLPYSLGPLIAPTAVANVHRAAGPFTPRNRRTITRSNCGIAICMTRAICIAGLPPAGLWPYRLLPTSLLSILSFPACAFSRFSTERLTRPYSRGLVRLRRSLSTDNHCQVSTYLRHPLKAACQEKNPLLSP